MEQIKVYSGDKALQQFVMENKVSINNLQKLLTISDSVNDVFVIEVDCEDYPQLVAVDNSGAQLAHIILSNEVVKGKSQALVFLDSSSFLTAGSTIH
tara:strand:+ start:213 stop:503 length:291 start_codon:yes stop_codon:yes gene_type:complete